MSFLATTSLSATDDAVATILRPMWVAASELNTRSAPVWSVLSACPAMRVSICAWPDIVGKSTLTPFLAKMPLSCAYHRNRLLGDWLVAVMTNGDAETEAAGFATPEA